MSYENMKLRPYVFFSAVFDIVKLFGEQEIGTCEVDIEAVANYVDSLNFSANMWGYQTKEQIYEKLTDDILNGWPVWRFLKVSDWTKDMLEKSFIDKQKKEREKLEKTYKCYTCKYFKEQHASIGTILDCEWEPPRENKYRSFKLKRRDDFSLKKKCKNYEAKQLDLKEV